MERPSRNTYYQHSNEHPGEMTMHIHFDDANWPSPTSKKSQPMPMLVPIQETEDE